MRCCWTRLKLKAPSQPHHPQVRIHRRYLEESRQPHLNSRFLVSLTAPRVYRLCWIILRSRCLRQLRAQAPTDDRALFLGQAKLTRTRTDVAPAGPKLQVSGERRGGKGQGRWHGAAGLGLPAILTVLRDEHSGLLVVSPRP